MHLGGLLVGAAVAPTLLLSLSYLFLAFAFAAVRLRTGVLWPLVGCYALLLTTGAAAQDTAAPNLVASVESILPAVIASLLLAAYGLFALPDSREWRTPNGARRRMGSPRGRNGGTPRRRGSARRRPLRAADVL
jgi:hypothetical protein